MRCKALSFILLLRIVAIQINSEAKPLRKFSFALQRRWILLILVMSKSYLDLFNPMIILLHFVLFTVVSTVIHREFGYQIYC